MFVMFTCNDRIMYNHIYVIRNCNYVDYIYIYRHIHIGTICMAYCGILFKTLIKYIYIYSFFGALKLICMTL